MSVKTTALLIFGLSLWCLSILAPQDATNGQIVTRLALTLSILDRGTVEITPFEDMTTDKARVGDHYYADKTPGHPLLALPAVALAKVGHGFAGIGENTLDPQVFFDYAKWATLGTNCLISALAIALVFLTAVGLGASRAGAIFAAFSLGWATPFLGWSTAFFAHSVTGSFLLFGLATILQLFPATPTKPARRWAILLLGLLLGYTLVIDLTAAPAVVILGIFALARSRKTSPLLPAMLLLGSGGLLGLLPLLVYNGLAFGSPFHLGYADTDYAGMQQGFFGITWPNPLVLMKLLFGLYRGLLPLSPVLIVVPFGLVAMAQKTDLRGVAWLIALIVVTYLWINASYYYWNGGWSLGPRHLVAMLPLAAVALAFAWPAKRHAKIAVSALLAISLPISVACALAGMFPPDWIERPFFDWVLPHVVTPNNAVRATFVTCICAALAVLLYRADRRPTGNATAEETHACLVPEPARGA